MRVAAVVLTLCIGVAACSRDSDVAGTGATATGSSASGSTASAPPTPTPLRGTTWHTGARLPVGVSEIGVALLGEQIHVLGAYVWSLSNTTVPVAAAP